MPVPDCVSLTPQTAPSLTLLPIADCRLPIVLFMKSRKIILVFLLFAGIALANLPYPETREVAVTSVECAIAQAGEERADIICFPECFVPGYRARAFRRHDGERRAAATRDYLVSLGVAADRLRTASYGKEAPACYEHGEDCWARNRRAHLTVSGKNPR